MRETLIKKAGSSFVAATGMILLLIFMAAMKHPQQKKAYTYLALGDSYTIGEKVKAAENFPIQAVALLREKQLDFKSPVIVAKTGWTTDELQAGIKKTKLQQHYDFVTLLIGVNNQYRDRTVADYTVQFEDLLIKATRYAHHNPRHVIVLSIPDWGVTPFAEAWDRKKIAAQIDEYNAANKRIAEKYRVHYIDITPGTREAANNKELLAEDDLHPSGKEYARWAKEVATVIQSELELFH
ncbi:MAG: SGNH/GDSL hydrolase family protein [Chitinophagaceae bacterium]